jgi:hypothetical protein
VLAGRAAANWRVEHDGTQVVVRNEGQTIKLPDRSNNIAGSIGVVERVGDRAYVAVYSSGSDSYDLHCIELISGKPLWSSLAWGRSDVKPRGAIVVGTSKSDWHVVAMQSNAELIVLFGFSGRAAYAEAFDRQTGENRCRFSTAYFELIELK